MTNYLTRAERDRLIRSQASRAGEYARDEYIDRRARIGPLSIIARIFWSIVGLGVIYLICVLPYAISYLVRGV